MTSYPSKQEGPGRLNMAVDLGGQSWYANKDPLSKRLCRSSWEYIDAFGWSRRRKMATFNDTEGKRGEEEVSSLEHLIMNL